MTSPTTPLPPPDVELHRPAPLAVASRWVTALSMTVGRSAAARAVAAAAGLQPGDRVVDLGCGPGTAVRVAARRGASAVGVDPDPAMLRLARGITAVTRPGPVGWLVGRAEQVDLPDGAATVVWTLSSLHHWDDRAAGLGEAFRLLAPGGRLVVAERPTAPGARGHAAHGISAAQLDALLEELGGVGFSGVRVEPGPKSGRRLVIVVAVRPIGGTDDAGPAAGQR